MKHYFFLIAFCIVGQAELVLADQPSDAQISTYGMVVNNVEKELVDVVTYEQAYWLRLEDIKKLFSVTFEALNYVTKLSTPIGNVDIPNDHFKSFFDETYISASDLERVLNIQSEFNQADYSFSFSVPWGEKTNKWVINKKLSADIAAPKRSLAIIHTETDYQKSGDDDFLESRVDLIGNIAGGSWVIGLEANNDEDDEGRANRYYYQNVSENTIYRVGTQKINLHNQAVEREYAGVQWAYSNRGISQYTDNFYSDNLDEFLNDDYQRFDSIVRNDGYPGGIAELRVNGESIAFARIQLDGRYGFNNIQRRENTFDRVKIVIYQNSIYGKPITEYDLTQTVADEMMGKGDFFIRAGAGTNGNPLFFDEDQAAFEKNSILTYALMRGGLSDFLTVVAGHQYSELDVGNDTTLFGLRTSLGDHLSLAYDNLSTPTDDYDLLSFQGHGQAWDFSLDLEWQEPSAIDVDESRERNHRFYSIYKASHLLSFGLIGRDELSDDKSIDFLKPWFAWNLRPDLRLSVDPSSDGIYETEVDYYYSSDTHFEFFSQSGEKRFTANHYFNNFYNIEVGVEKFDAEASSQFVNMYWNPSFNSQNNIKFGVRRQSNQIEYSLSLYHEFKPGLALSIDYNQNDSGITQFGDDKSLFINLRYDLASNGRKYLSADNRAINLTRGGINGKIVDQNGRIISADNVGVFLNQRSVSQSAVNGIFHAQNIPAGVYELELDQENLPIEYSVDTKPVTVEVAASAVTRFDFKVVAKYGISGKIVKDDLNAGKITLDVINNDGEIIQQVSVSKFGYFRIDDLPVGTYSLTVNDEKSELARQEVKIKDKFIFGLIIKINSPQTEKLLLGSLASFL